ncbi:MAG: hypothetical protein QW273_00905 [Candidatus Pacearchaeota archaeon]
MKTKINFSIEEKKKLIGKMIKKSKFRNEPNVLKEELKRSDKNDKSL